MQTESQSISAAAAVPTWRPPAAPVVAAPAIPERTRRMLAGPVLPTLLKMAVPSIVVVVVQATSSAVDAFWLGRLGPEVLAGVALVFPTWMLMVTMSAGGIGGGIASSVARALGGGRKADADELVTHSVALAVALSALFSAVVLLAGPRLYQAMAGTGASGPALDAAVTYSTAVFAGALAIWLVNALASVLRGSGEMLVPAVVIVVGELLHLALAPALIFGLGPFPGLGVAGAGISLVTSYALRAVALGAFVLSGRAGVRLSTPWSAAERGPAPWSTAERGPLGRLRLRRSVFWDILRVGLPGSLNTVLTNANVMAITTLVGPAGVFALAGYGLAARLEYLQIPLVFGFGTALVTMVGTNIGAGQVQRARRVTWVGAIVAALATGTVGLVVAVNPDLWLRLFTAEPAVLAVGETYLHIVGPTFGLFGLGLALYFAAQGAGNLTWPLLAGAGRLVLAVGGGWLAIYGLQGGLPWLFAAVGVAFAAFGVVQALAVTRVIRAPASSISRE